VRRLPWLVIALLALTPIMRAEGPAPILIYVTAPPEALVAVDGVPVKQTGPQRRLITPPFETGQKATYTLSATFTKDGKTVVLEKVVNVEGGKVSRVDLTSGPTRVVEAKTIESKKEEVKITPKKEEPKKEVHLDAPYKPTPNKIVEEMLKLASVKEGDVVYDLGSGDGRIVIAAVEKFKAKKGVGIELAPERVKLSKENAGRAGVAGKVEIRESDLLKLTDVSEANVVTLYLLPEVNQKLKPMLQKSLKPGSRVVSHDFNMGDWKADKEITVLDEVGKPHVLYLWTIPAPKKEEVKVTPKKEEPKKIKLDAPFIATPQSVVDDMLKFASVKEGDVVYDLGCGDGRIVITAVKDFKAKKGVGIDLDPERIADSKKAAKNAKVEDKVEFREGDVLKIDSVAEASVVCLYLFPEINERLQPMLQKTLKPGSRIVSHDFLMKDDWKPEKEITVKDQAGNDHTIYMWTIKEAKK
jgi:uncharacterized protein (TIGR03000 family)